MKKLQIQVARQNRWYFRYVSLLYSWKNNPKSWKNNRYFTFMSLLVVFDRHKTVHCQKRKDENRFLTKVQPARWVVQSGLVRQVWTTNGVTYRSWQTSWLKCKKSIAKDQEQNHHCGTFLSTALITFQIWAKWNKKTMSLIVWLAIKGWKLGMLAIRPVLYGVEKTVTVNSI